MAIVNRTVAEYLAERPFNAGDDVTIVDTGAAIAALSPAQFAELAANNVDAIDANDGTLTLDTSQALALGTVRLVAGDSVTVADTGANLGALTPAQITELAANNVDAFDASDNVLTLGTQQLAALGSIALVDGDAVTLADSGANLAALTSVQIAALASRNVDTLDASDDALTLDTSQALALGTVRLSASDTVTVADTGANLSLLSADQITALAANNVGALDATGDDTLSINTSQLGALIAGGVTLNLGDTVTLAEFGDVLSGGDESLVADLAVQGIDVIDALDNQLTYSAAMVDALGTVTLTPADVVTLADSVAVITGLTQQQIVDYETLGVDRFVLADTGTNLAALTDLQIQALAVKGVDGIDATGDIVSMNVAQIDALGAITFAANDTVTLADTAANLAALSTTQIAALTLKGVDFINSSDNALSLSLAQADALGSVRLAAEDVVTVSGDSALLTAGQLSALSTAGVDILDAENGVTILTVEKFLASGELSFASGDTVTLQDAGGALSSLSAGQIRALGGKGIDAINASDNVLSLSLAQFNALGAVHLTAGDTVTLTDSGTALSSLAPSQLAALSGQGVDAVNATGPLTLTTAQYTALGIPLVGGGALTVAGSSSADHIFGTARSETLKGFNGNDLLSGGLGDDKLFGGAGKDSLTGGGGRDAFVFDTKLSKKNNLDKIADFNINDDSVYLDNAIFKKLGKGTEAFPKKLVKSYFTVGSEAKDKNDYVIYDKKKGILYYDQDGSGSKDQVEITTLKKNLKMTYNDFFVI
jgi:antitoxin (DNA-binding transcriptional repressor) of toxin-antitoxin stability system